MNVKCWVEALEHLDEGDSLSGQICSLCEFLISIAWTADHVPNPKAHYLDFVLERRCETFAP